MAANHKMTGNQVTDVTAEVRSGAKRDSATGRSVFAGVDDEAAELQQLYSTRFDDTAFRREMWRILAERFFQGWVPRDATVVEVAAGYCEFINSISARRRVAVDLNPDVEHHAAEGVEHVVSTATDLGFLEDGSVDVVFISNFFEHISREEILLVLREARRVLHPQRGRLLVLQPNIRFCAKDYWMFFDHVTPVDDRALVEAFALTDLRLEHLVLRFLPFTTKSQLPRSTVLVKAYLRARPLWRILGKQSFLVARPL